MHVPADGYRARRPSLGRRRAAHAFIALFALAAASAALEAQPFTFAAPIIRPFGSQHFPTHIGTADLNGDGHTDLVLPGRDVDGIVNYVLGNGDGTFGPLQQVLVETQTDWVEIRDFNGDDKLDLALAIRSFDGRVALVFGNGDGTFSKEVAYYHVGRETRSLIAADLDGDSDVDIVASNYGSADVVVLRNLGSGVFATGQRTLINEYVAGQVFPQQLAVGDLDGDGDGDLVLTSIGSGRVSILCNNGQAVFAPEIAYAPPALSDQRPAVTNSVLVDMDRDGDLDIVSPLGYIGVPPRFALFLNDGAGVFNTIQTFPANLGSISWVPAAGDLDSDGDIDLAFGYGLAGDLTLVKNNSAGGPLTFGAPQLSVIGEFVRFIVMNDLDHDCDLDLVLVEFGSQTFQVFKNQTPQQSGCGAAGVAALSDGPDHRGPVMAWRQLSSDDTRASGPPAPRLDANGDGRVDAADLVTELAQGPAAQPALTPAPPGSAGQQTPAPGEANP